MPEPDYRQFLIDTLEKRRSAFSRNYASVVEKPDPDPVHDLRVSIRRLSAILSLLAKLSRRDAGNEIGTNLEKMLKPLGELRDVHVRIEWIKQFSPHPSNASEKIVGMLQEIEKSIIESIVPNLEAVFSDRIKGFRSEDFVNPVDKMLKVTLASLDDLCHREILFLLKRFAKRFGCFKKNGSTTQMHRARIALKKFRYTFEIFSDFYPGLKLDVLQDFQTRLGDMHDLELLAEWLAGQKETIPLADQQDLERLSIKAEGERKRRLYKLRKNLAGDIEVLKKWRDIMKEGKDGKKKAALKNARAEVVSLCERFDPDPPHAAYVTKLAIKLFDELGKLGLHEIDERHKILFEYGCLLHDIGWVDGQQKHHKRSFKMICEADLPLNKKDKLTIALIARFHRKGEPGKQEEFLELPRKDRAAIAKLAAIIRIADVLDRLHNRNVKIEGVAVKDDKVVITVSAGAIEDISEDAISKKSAYFRTAFGMPAVVIEKGAAGSKAGAASKKSGA